MRARNLEAGIGELVISSISKVKLRSEGVSWCVQGLRAAEPRVEQRGRESVDRSGLAGAMIDLWKRCCGVRLSSHWTNASLGQCSTVSSGEDVPLHLSRLSVFSVSCRAERQSEDTAMGSKWLPNESERVRYAQSKAATAAAAVAIVAMTP